MMTPAELLKKVRRVWSVIGPAPIEDMRNMRWFSGDQAAKAFMGIKPVDVDIDSPGFQAAEPLLELPGRAAAAYLGTYLISLLDGLDIEEKAGFSTDITTRAHTVTVMMAPNFWPEIAAPYLPPACLGVVGEVAELMISRRELLALTDAEVARLERLVGSVRRELGT